MLDSAAIHIFANHYSPLNAALSGLEKIPMSHSDLNFSADENNARDSAKLAAYRDTKTTAIIAASLLIPFGTVAFFVWFCRANGGDYAFNASVKIGDWQRIALIVHGLYFILLPFSFELMIDKLPFPGCPSEYRFGKVSRPDNLYWMMTCLSAELFFVGAVTFLLLASQIEVPRWALILPSAQCSYNMKNDLLWVGFGATFSPIRKRMTIMTLDWFVIGACFVIYIHHFFTATIAV